ncbi:hypothetical protein PG993_009867 [Apiospora rasikravindrae]|uniref:Uncharacterized protein n=1 Tax=Apiospora rasikravindrae TaxID=990691 RepID=A0ABR1SKM0_9PEZI
MYSLWKATSRALATCASSRSSSADPEWCGQRVQTIFYLRQRGRALLEACHGRVEDLTETILEEQLERLLDVEDEAEFELRADRIAGMFAFRFAAMRLATEVLRDDMRDYKIGLPGGSPCTGWDETAWQRSTAETQGPEAYARRMALVGSLMEDAHLTETGPPFRPGLGQGVDFCPARTLPSCRARRIRDPYSGAAFDYQKPVEGLSCASHG